MVNQNLDFMQLLADGGTGVFIVVALSILALAVVFERLRHFRLRFIAPPELLAEIKPMWHAGEFAQIQMRLAKEDSILARVILFMVTHRHQDYAVIGSSVGDIASIEMRRHQQKAYALAIVATVAPIVGLLGTVIGMIEAFHVIASVDGGMGNPALLAGGISKALINTAAGLSVALPALGMHHFFRNRAVFFSLTLEAAINQLMVEWFMPKQSGASTAFQVAGHAN